MRRLAPIWAALPIAVLPSAAAAHATGRALILLLPTGYYLAGGALAVAVSFAVLSLAPPGRWLRRAGAGLRLPFGWPPLAGAVQWVAFGVFAALLALGVAGPHDPLENLLPLTLWTLWWVGFTGLVAITGDLWPLLNPWSAPLRLARRLGIRPSLRLPAATAYWPALAGLFGFIWYEIVSIEPSDPATLARAAAAYWLVHFAAMLAFGERRWRARAETFSVFFRLIGRIAPLRFDRCGIALVWPGARLARAAALPLSGWLFVSALIASISFDGLSATFAWLGFIGVNPLEFPGRSAVVTENTLGLAGAWVALALAYAGAVAAGRAISGSRAGFAVMLGRIGLSLVPIALAYHLAHYLTVLMVNGQYAIAAAGDPFDTGADWLGLGGYRITTSFFSDLGAAETVWQVQTAIIVLGHVLAVAVAHAIALDIEADRRRAALSQAPLAVLMVALTLLGLWLLSAPTGA